MATIVFAASVDDTMFPIAISGFENSEPIVSVGYKKEYWHWVIAVEI